MVEVSKVIAFSTLTFLLGFSSLAGLLFSLVPLAFPGGTAVHFLSVRILGAVLLLSATGYALLGVLRKTPLVFRVWQLEMPSPPLVASQFAVAIADLLVTAGALFALLPASSGLSFWLFATMFLAALLVGLISNVPGGLGVFESMMLFFLSPYISAAAAAGPCCSSG